MKIQLLFILVLLSGIAFGQQATLSIGNAPNNQLCQGPLHLIANPMQANAKYVWYKNNIPINQTVNNQFIISAIGNYTVKIIVADSVMLTSNVLPILECPTIPRNLEAPVSINNTAPLAQGLPNNAASNTANSVVAFTGSLTSTNNSLCDGNTSATLTASPTGSGYTYEWSYYPKTGGNGSWQPLTNTSSSITTSNLGRYRVKITETATGYYNYYAIYVDDATIITITNSNDELYGYEYPASGQSTPLKVSFTGTAPYSFSYYTNNIYDNPTTISTNNNPYILNVNPAINSTYSLRSGSSSNCGQNYYNSGFTRVIVDQTTNITFNTPSNLNVCAGETIDISYNQVGTWNSSINLHTYLSEVSNTNNIYNISESRNHWENPLKITIPDSLALGSKIRIWREGVIPYFQNMNYSNFTYTVTNTGCSPTARIATYNNAPCNYTYLDAHPSGNGETYQWFKDNVAIPNANSYFRYVTENGNYKVTVTNGSYSSTSDAIPITSIITPVITSPNPFICGTTTPITLTASPGTGAYTYQWQYAQYQYDTYTEVPAATSATLSTSTLGWYKVILTNGTCNFISQPFEVSSTARATLTDLSGNTNSTINVSPNQNVDLKVSFTGNPPYRFTNYLNDKEYIHETSNNPYYFSVNTATNAYTGIDDLYNECRFGQTSGQHYIITDNTTSLTLQQPSSLNVCAGETIEIPFTKIGTWPVDHRIYVYIVDNNGNYIQNDGGTSWYESSPIKFTLPSDLILNGQYKIEIYGISPNFQNSIPSTYNLTVTSTSCTPAALLSVDYKHCSYTILRATPYFYDNNTNTSEYSYRWYKDNVELKASGSRFEAYAPGSYKVEVYKSGYTSMSNTIIVPNSSFLEATSLTTDNPYLCTSNSSTLLTAKPTGTGYSYYWLKRNNIDNSTKPIFNNNQATYLATETGTYYVQTSKSGCISKAYLELPEYYWNSSWGINYHQNNVNSTYKGSFNSQDIIDQPSRTNYWSTKEVLLNPGFEAKPGSVFRAEVKTCP